MITIIIYDISQTNDRNKVIKILQHYGLKRIQKSAFAGYMDSQQRDSIYNELEPYTNEEKNSIILIPLCDTCENKIRYHGQIKMPIENEDYEILWGNDTYEISDRRI